LKTKPGSPFWTKTEAWPDAVSEPIFFRKIPCPLSPFNNIMSSLKLKGYLHMTEKKASLLAGEVILAVSVFFCTAYLMFGSPKYIMGICIQDYLLSWTCLMVLMIFDIVLVAMICFWPFNNMCFKITLITLLVAFTSFTAALAFVDIIGYELQGFRW
jgi:ABC-type Na+ efflux pump permease subunit